MQCNLTGMGGDCGKPVVLHPSIWESSLRCMRMVHLSDFDLARVFKTKEPGYTQALLQGARDGAYLPLYNHGSPMTAHVRKKNTP